MKHTQILGAVALISAVAIAIQCARAETPAPSAAALEPIAFLTTHEWDAKLPDSPEGKKKKIHARFTWTQNGQAIRISNEFVTDGKASPYIDGLYAWDPQQHVIRVLVCRSRRKSHQRHSENGRWKTGARISGDTAGRKGSRIRSASNTAWE